MDTFDQEWQANLKQWLEQLKQLLDENQKKFQDSLENKTTPGHDYFKNYQQEYQAYQSQLTQLQTQALDLLNLKLKEFYNNNQRIETFDQVYEIWLDCCSTVHEKMIATKSYQQFYGHLINAFMAWTRQAKKNQAKY